MLSGTRLSWVRRTGAHGDAVRARRPRPPPGHGRVGKPPAAKHRDLGTHAVDHVRHQQRRRHGAGVAAALAPLAMTESRPTRASSRAWRPGRRWEMTTPRRPWTLCDRILVGGPAKESHPTPLAEAVAQAVRAGRAGRPVFARGLSERPTSDPLLEPWAATRAPGRRCAVAAVSLGCAGATGSLWSWRVGAPPSPKERAGVAVDPRSFVGRR